MAKFFRIIRHKLLAENQFSKYLAYAIGEIVLVVIGILIALSRNSWDQSRTERKQETLLLVNLRSDLKEQSASLIMYVEVETKFGDNGASVLKQYARHKGFSEMDSVLPKLNSLISRRTFNPINTTFRELISTGTIGLIQNDSLKRAIMRYYNNLERINLIVSNNNARLVDGLFNPVALEQTVLLADDVDPELEKINLEIFDPESVKTLRSTSRLILSNPQKALHLFNALEERMNVAFGHKELYVKLQAETNLLHQAIQNELDK